MSSNINPTNLNDIQAQLYLNKYADLKAAFGNNIKNAKEHWVKYGIREGRSIYDLKKHNSVAFCFLVTGDLVKEHIWIEWLNRLEKLGLNINIYVHCSNPENIKSEWLKKYLIPTEYICPTQWGFLMKASFNMYKYSFNNKNNDWFINLSETHVPYVSPEKFINIYNNNYDKTYLSYTKPWWNVNKISRGNLNKVDSNYHYAHQQWCIISNYDMKLMIQLINNNYRIVLDTIDSCVADESIIAVYLSYLDRLKNTINEVTTIVDWERSPNGNNPYTFNDWTSIDQAFLNKFIINNKSILFLRKVSKSFPDNIIFNWWDK